MVNEAVQSDLLRWIVALPLIGALIHGAWLALVRRPFSKALVVAISCGAVIGSFLLSCVALVDLGARPEGERLLVDEHRVGDLVGERFALPRDLVVVKTDPTGGVPPRQGDGPGGGVGRERPRLRAEVHERAQWRALGPSACPRVVVSAGQDQEPGDGRGNDRDEHQRDHEDPAGPARGRGRRGNGGRGRGRRNARRRRERGGRAP